MKWLLTAVTAVATFSSGCETARASQLPTPKERVTECEQICTGVGMKLSAMVVMMNSAGCVCEVINSSAPTSSKGGGAAGGGAVIAASAAAMAQQQQLQQQQMLRQQQVIQQQQILLQPR